jgi:hypothetical protein
MRREAVTRFGRELLEAAHPPPEVAAPADADDADASLGRGRRPSNEEKATIDRLRALRADLAGELGLDPGVLCPSRAVTAAVLAAPRTPEELRAALALRDWQWDILAEPFGEALGLDAGGQDPQHADVSTGGS